MKATREYLRGRVPFLHWFFENFKSSSSWCFISMRKFIFSSTLPGDSSRRWDNKLSWWVLTSDWELLLLPLHGPSWPCMILRPELWWRLVLILAGSEPSWLAGVSLGFLLYLVVPMWYRWLYLVGSFNKSLRWFFLLGLFPVVLWWLAA